MQVVFPVDNVSRLMTKQSWYMHINRAKTMMLDDWICSFSCGSKSKKGNSLIQSLLNIKATKNNISINYSKSFRNVLSTVKLVVI